MEMWAAGMERWQTVYGRNRIWNQHTGSAGKVEIYNDGVFQVFCNFNFEGNPKIQARYIGGSEEDITDADIFLDKDTIEEEFSEDYVSYILPLLKEWYYDNKEILRKIWRTKCCIHIPDWV